MNAVTEELRRKATHRAPYRVFGYPMRHPGQFADCLLCTPRTSGPSLPNYRREGGA